MLQECIEDTDYLDYYNTEYYMTVIHNLKKDYESYDYDNDYKHYYDYVVNNYKQLEKIEQLKIYELTEDKIKFQIPQCKSMISVITQIDRTVFIRNMCELLTLLWNNDLSLSKFKLSHLGINKHNGKFMFVNPKYIDHDPICHATGYLRSLQYLKYELDIDIYNEIYEVMKKVIHKIHYGR